MRLTSSRAYYRPSPPKLPPGLVELMEGLTKEVLKHNPSDIYGFCAGHMQQLLDKRDGPSSKKALPLEEKIARAQGKVRQRAENRRKEYDKNVIVERQNNNATNNVIKTNSKLKVPKDSSVIFDKDNVEVAQNIVNTPIHHDQVLKDSGEMEISNDSRCTVSKPTEDVDDNKDNKQNVGNVQEVETVHPQISEKCQSVTGTESNQQNGSTIVNNISSNMKPDTETLNKDLIGKNTYESSKLLNVTNQINKNQDENLIKHEGQSEMYHQKIEPAEIESKKSLYVCGVDNIPNENSKGENITDSKDSKQTVDTVGIEKNLSYTFKAEQVNLDNFNNNEKVTIEDRQLPTDLIDMYDSTSPHHTDNNVRQHQNTENVQLSTPIDDVQQCNDATDSFTHSDVLRTVHRDDVDLDNIDDPRKNNSEILLELIEKDTQEKGDGVKELNNTTTSGKVRDQHEQIQSIFMGVNDNMQKMQTPQMGFPETGVDSDIQTLVTENSVNDAYDINNVGGTLQLKIITSLDDMHQENEKKSNLEQISAENLCDHTKHCDKDTVSTENVSDFMYENESKNDDTSQDKTSQVKKIHENNQNENQGANMDLETAAITIQKVFRNFLFKSRGSTFEDTANDEGNFMDEDNKNKEECNFSITNSLSTDRRAHGIARMDTMLQTVNEEKSLSLSTDDSSTLSSAATIIQAHVRGFLVRNKLNSNKTVSSASVAASNSNEPSYTSIEAGSEQTKNKNVLNIHIVPEGENYLSRDESLITSMDLSLDSPPSSINLHPLGYDKSERRKLKREDAIQSISPPSNNSGKLSEDLDSVKELPASAHDIASHLVDDINQENNKNIPIENALTATDLEKNETIDTSDYKTLHSQSFLSKKESLTKNNLDETDVVTPFVSNEDLTSSKLTHSGEFHDAVLPTRVSRSDTSVVSEFKNVLVYFLLWNHS